MTTHDQARPALAPFFSFIVMLGAILLSSCAGSSIRTSPPPSGMGVLDTTPDPSRRDRINDMRIVAVNGQPAKGDEAELSSGKNRVRVGFSWPQGGSQDLDLDFKVTPGKIYAVYCDVYPPLSRNVGALGQGVGSMVSSEISDPYVPLVMGLVVGSVVPFLAAESAANQASDHSAPAEYVDVMVVAQRSSQGIVCNRRVYPNGKIEKR